MSAAVETVGSTRSSFRPSPVGRWLFALYTAIFAGIAAFVAAIAVAAIPDFALFALVIFACAAVIIALTCLLAAETAASFFLDIEISDDALRLKLPRRRGHVPRDKVDETIPLASIAGIETRSEVFRQLGAVSMQQAWRLILKDGRAIELGADRDFKGVLFGAAARAITARLNVEIVDRGVVDASAGVLAVYGTSAPPWTAPSVPEGEIAKRIAGRARTRALLVAAVALTAFARFIARR